VRNECGAEVRLRLVYIDPVTDLAELAPGVRAIVETARKTIRSIRRDAEETSCDMRRPRSASMMWKLARYAVAGEVVVTIGAFTKHASIFFARGNELADPTGLLSGSGKSLRYITLRTPKDVTSAAVRAIVRHAFELAARPPARDGATTRAEESAPRAAKSRKKR
jgi:hypothetical protein